MSYEPGRKRAGASGGNQRAGGGGTPGKRVLTDGMQRRAPEPASMEGYRARRADLARAAPDPYYDPERSIEEHRATLPVDLPIDTSMGDDTLQPDWSDDANGLLTDAQAAHAARRNPRQQDRLGFHPTELSVFPIDSEAFAIDVAELQRSHGVTVDGIVGPVTCRAAGIAVREHEHHGEDPQIDLGGAPDKLPLE